MKLSKKKPPFDPQEKARKLVASIPSKNLILEAFLFGSAVDGTFTEDSDLDILLVVNEAAHIKKILKEVSVPHFSDIAVDWIVKTSEEFSKRKSLGGVCFEAFHHGKKLL